MELISLNLIYDYPVRWTKFKVLRDFVQNFYDAVKWCEWKERFSYTLSDGVLQLKARDVGFSYDWLLHIGASTKREDTGSYAGYFGEGFKIASLCAVRDHNWNVEIFSRDWQLSVATTDLIVDERSLKSLAYNVQRNRKKRTDTVLSIFPFNDISLLHTVLLSFYYPENPLLGEKIWESSGSAIFFRSTTEKPDGYPSTYGDRGQGIIFAGYQAQGSFQHPMVFCLHDYQHDDRERGSFYRMDVIKIIQMVSSRLSPDASTVVLHALKRRWYEQPKRKYDFESWHGIIKTLIRNIAGSAEQTAAWREANPNLLVARQVKRNDLSRYNSRRQALDWLKILGGGFRLVQGAFVELGYPVLEDVCEKNGGFSITCEPNVSEKKRIAIIEQLVQNLIPALFTKIEMPPCKIIKNERASWQGMTTCIPLNDCLHDFYGIPIRYQLPYIALKKSLLQADAFGEALSTYFHELAHMFGGHRSVYFSRALSTLMEITLSNAGLIAEWQKKW
ncbi:MAG: hypothetical protein U9N77_06255 [Thermodesulfobacteriota bacterium]|nr:hypothetical protein [Thermodesulfobacteriota bacterium]